MLWHRFYTVSNKNRIIELALPCKGALVEIAKRFLKDNEEVIQEKHY